MKRVLAVLIALNGLASGLPRSAGAAGGAPDGIACSAYVARVEALDASGTQYAIALQSQDPASRISGTVALFANGDRYDVPFADVRVAAASDPAVPVPIVVQFPAAVHLDGAVVAAIGSGGAAQRCAPFSPWAGRDNDAMGIGAIIFGTTRNQTPTTPYDAAATTTRWNAFRAQAAGTAAIPSGAATAIGAPACAQPYRVATTRRAVPPDFSQVTMGRMASGTARVRVLLDAGGALTGTSLLGSSGDRYLDQAAIEAAKRSEFQAASFRCEPVAGAYVFTVSFGP